MIIKFELMKEYGQIAIGELELGTGELLNIERLKLQAEAMGYQLLSYWIGE